MGEQTPLAVRDPPFGGAHAAASGQHHAFCCNQAGLSGNRPNERNLEFEGRLADALLESRQDRQPHAAIEQRGRETTVHRASRVEMVSFGSAPITTRPLAASVMS